MTISSSLRASLFVAILCVAPATWSGASAETLQIPKANYVSEEDGFTVSFLARDTTTGTEYVLEGSDLDTRHVPWSTFKIPNLVLALETNVAASLRAWRDWNPAQRPAAAHWPAEWQEGQDLGTAFARSSVWYFQDLALDVGTDTYRTKLAEWHYGDGEVPDGSDDFWLDGSLTISVREQVDFLGKLLTGRLGVSAASLAALNEASRSGRAGEGHLHGKTGAGPDDPSKTDGSFSGWYAGYILRDDRPLVVFALHMAGPSFTSIRDARRALVVRLLADLRLSYTP